ncbi:hypothetical protein DSO57_1027684 [Entomophthora muscae]|uniref:Uncharacterized protein n=1 Tax=Entomophthora muscae TaxID=34485 RepID=A0ACC2RSM3_9FUNG|nr:hypothetical protein DSO57_1027684 [Entomophthora muscae]
MKLPLIAVEEIFSLLERRQVYKLRLLCLDFYQAAFPILLRVHSLKRANQIEYQHFLKRNGKHVRGLIIQNSKSYQALLDSGLSVSTAFPNLRSLSCSASHPTFLLCDRMVEDWLGLQQLKHLSLETNYHKFISIFFPLFKKLSSLFGYFNFQEVQKIHQNCKGLKKLLTKSLYIDDRIVTLFQESSDVPFEAVFIDLDGDEVPLNAKARNCGWSYLTDGPFDCDQLRLHLGPSYSKNMASIGLKNSLGFNLKVLENINQFKKIVKIPNFLKHLTVNRCSMFMGSMAAVKLITNIPSLHFQEVDFNFFNEAYVFQATQVSFGNYGVYESNVFNFEIKHFPNLQKLYISRKIPQETMPLLQGFFPNLILFSSEARQCKHFWLKLLELAPNLQHIHTNHVPRDILDIIEQRPTLRFMPYQNIFGKSGNIYDISKFNKYLS